MRNCGNVKILSMYKYVPDVFVRQISKFDSSYGRMQRKGNTCIISPLAMFH